MSLPLSNIEIMIAESRSGKSDRSSEKKKRRLGERYSYFPFFAEK
jgi:hypothetical protein